MIGIVLGKIVGLDTKVPDRGDDFNGHQIIQVLQVHDGVADLAKIKDYDLKHRYEIDQDVELICRINAWGFDGRSGLSAIVVGE